MGGGTAILVKEGLEIVNTKRLPSGRGMAAVLMARGSLTLGNVIQYGPRIFVTE